MGKATVYYFTFFDTDKSAMVRPRRPGTLEAIGKTGLENLKPLMRTALEVDESELDDDGFYPRRDRTLGCVGERHARPVWAGRYHSGRARIPGNRPSPDMVSEPDDALSPIE